MLRMVERRFCILSLLFLIISVSTFSDIGVRRSIDIHGGMIWIGNAEPEGAPSPLLNIISVSLPIRFSNYFSFSPEFGFFGTQYGFSDGSLKVVPLEREAPDAGWILSVLVEPIFTFDLNLSDRISIGLLAAPVFLLRVPTVSWGEGSAQLGEITAYLYESGRFFYTTAGLSFSWAAHENVSLIARVISYLPVFHIWDNESYPFYDMLMLSGTIGFRVFSKE
jgi:hypothetical protein